MHRLRGHSRDLLPGLVGRESQNRSQRLGEPGEDAVQGGLRAASAGRAGRIGVEPVLDHVVVHGAELHGTELRDQLVHDVELVGVVGLSHRRFQRGELTQDPTVESAELIIGDRLGRWIEVVQVGELVAQGVADEAVGFTDLLEPLLADHDVAAVVL